MTGVFLKPGLWIFSSCASLDICFTLMIVIFLISDVSEIVDFFVFVLHF